MSRIINKNIMRIKIRKRRKTTILKIDEKKNKNNIK